MGSVAVVFKPQAFSLTECFELLNFFAEQVVETLGEQIVEPVYLEVCRCKCVYTAHTGMPASFCQRKSV